MPDKTMDDVMEAASGPHFSGLRHDSLRLSSPSTPSSPSSAKAAAAAAAVYENASPEAPKQLFVIGVSGGTASGKSTVCNMIIQQLHEYLSDAVII